mgnify:CR=1 FL=1
MSGPTHFEELPFKVDDGLGARARIGAIILQSDQTAEHEFATLLRQDGVALYHARIPNAMDVTPETLRAMERDLPAAAALLPGAFDFDAIGYCCTSGATMIGEGRVDEIIREIHPGAKTTNPLTACKAAVSSGEGGGRFAAPFSMITRHVVHRPRPPQSAVCGTPLLRDISRRVRPRWAVICGPSA